MTPRLAIANGALRSPGENPLGSGFLFILLRGRADAGERHA
jgi:hypothetical protein